MGLTHAGQKNRVSLVLYNVERTGLQVLRHGGNFIKLPALDFGEEAAELPDHSFQTASSFVNLNGPD